MTKIRVRPGDKVTVGIAGDPPVVSPAKPSPSKYIGVDPPEDQTYVFGKKGNITLFDLAVRSGQHMDLSSLDVTGEVVLQYTAWNFSEFAGNGICGGPTNTPVSGQVGDFAFAVGLSNNMPGKNEFFVGRFPSAETTDWALGLQSGEVRFLWVVYAGETIAADGSFIVTGGVPIIPGSSTWVFPWDSLVEIWPGLNVGICADWFPASPFAVGGYARIWGNNPSSPAPQATSTITSMVNPVGTEAYNSIMLSGAIEDCLQLPQHSEYLYLDLVFKQGGQEDKRILAGAPGKRPYVKDIPAEGDPDPPPVTQADWINRAGKLKASGSWHVGADARFFYNSFSTSGNYKVTGTPDPEAEAIDFQITSADKLKIYLTPRLFDWQYNEVVLDRLPVAPSFEAITGGPIFLGLTQGDGVIGEPTADYWQQIFAHFGDEFSGGVDFSLHEFVGLQSNLLTAIIVKGENTFYVWRIAAEGELQNFLGHQAE